MNKYRAKIKHDTGEFNMYTSSTSKESAINSIMKAERCPRRSILLIEQDTEYLKREFKEIKDNLLCDLFIGVWGYSMSFLFSLCDVLEDRCICPNYLEFEQSILGSEKDESYIFLDEYSNETLLYIAKIMNRYTDYLRYLGKDY